MQHRLSDIGQIAITVSDVSVALAFYRDVLGLQFLFSPSTDLAFLSAGEIRLMLSTPQGAGVIGGNSILYFKVDNLSQVFSAVVARGATIDHEPHLVAKLPDHELWIGSLRDPDGNLIGMMEEKR
jgi:methylmalonyl-CoA/ethylmalonyl-CoA epimerase